METLNCTNFLTTAFNLEDILNTNANTLAEIFVNVYDLQKNDIALASQGKEQEEFV